MSILEQAKFEMDLAGFDEGSKATFNTILNAFFEEWDSGGAVHWAAPILQRLIAGKPLSPLTGDDIEWNDVSYGGNPVWQNKRCSTVFKEERDGEMVAYNIDDPGRPPISFPYWPTRAEVGSAVIAVEIAASPTSQS